LEFTPSIDTRAICWAGRQFRFFFVFARLGFVVVALFDAFAVRVFGLPPNARSQPAENFFVEPTRIVVTAVTLSSNHSA
jgi:hypothetical protein